MANDTLSNNVNEDENSNLRGRQSSGKELSTCSSASSEVSGLRRSARDLLSRKRRASSPPSIRKSERLVKQTSVSPVRRASERVDKKLTPSPLRRSERGKHLSPSSGSRRGSGKSSSSSSSKQKKAIKEKNVKRMNPESREVTDNEKQDLKLKVKSKRYDSRAYRSYFKNRKKKSEAADRGENENRGSKLRKGGIANCRSKVNSIDECTERTMDDLNEEHILETCAEKKLEYNGGGMVVSDLSLKPSCGEKDNDGVGVLRDGECNLVPSVATTKKISESESMQVGCSAAEKLKVPDFIDSPFKGRTLNNEYGSPKSQDILPSKRKMTMVDIDADVSRSNAKKRLNLDSTKHGSMCNTNLNHELSSAFRTQVSGKQGAGFTLGLAEKCDNDIQRKESTADLQTADNQNTCFICKQGGRLLCCDGRGCNRSYHLKCINPPMDDVPIGLWYCSRCVEKKTEFGVQSVSKGVESVLDAREVAVSEVDVPGIKRKEYFVKYKGIAHIHNCWVPESKLLREAPLLVAKFNRKNQLNWLKPEWTVPQRLLQKRPLTLHKHSVDNLGFRHEWLVKWCGLDYKHATWELENSSIFNSPEGQHLIDDFQNRVLKAKIENKELDREIFSPELDQLPAGFSGSDNSNLDHINKLRKLWYDGKNAAIMDDQERIKKVVAFVMSLQSDVCQPFLIISTSSALYSWYDEFLRLAPTVNAVVYSGDKDSRRLIRKLEFYEKSGCIMFQVLIATSKVIIEDLDVLEDIGWETVVFDDFQRIRIPFRAKLKMLTTKMRLLLVSSPLKDSTAEYSSSLSLLDSDGGLDNRDPSLNSSLENFNKLKETFSRYVVFGWKSNIPRFKEYWVPVELSNVQLEQYCNILISNATLLRSSLKTDIIGALCDMLRTIRKCCDHPYVVNQILQTKLIEGLPEVEWLDVGIKASGKLQLLEKMLLEINRQGLRALVIFQSISGSGRDSIGDILDDVMRQRFGPNSYEHVDASVNPPKKQAALNNFNNKECGRFVFLLDARACSPSIKLYSIDAVIVFGSDWNPMNDVKQLQKIKIYSPSEQLKIFRLYSSFTVEEKVLSLAKQGKNLDSNLQNVGRTTILSLLIWGASQQFEKLDKFHASNTLASCANILPKESPLQDVISGFLSILPPISKDIDLEKSSIISNAQQVGGVYSSGSLLLGETKSHLIDEDQPHVFWSKLLEGKNPKWIYSSALPLGNRRRLQHSEDLLKKPEADSGEIIKKHKKCVSSCTESSSHELVSDEEVAAGDKEGVASAVISPCSLPMSNVCPNEALNASSGFTLPHLDYNVCKSSGASIFESEERRKLLDTQKTLYLHLKPEIPKLCNILQLSDLAKGVADMFLMYMMHNHHVNREPVETLQAFEVSVCWFAASFVKQKIDHKESLLLAREHLNFRCKKEDVEHQYSLLRCLKRVFLYRTGNLDAAVFSKSSSKEGVKDDLQESLTQLVASDKDGPYLLGSSPEFKLAAKDILKSIKEIKKKCQKQFVKLVKIQKEEKNQLVREYEEEMEKLEKKHRLEEAVVLTLYPNKSLMRTDKLNLLKASQRRTLEQYQHQIDMRLENLEIEQQAARNEMEEGGACWVEAVKSWAIGELLGKPPSKEPWQCREYSQTKEQICEVNAEDAIPVSEKVLVTETREQNRAAASGDQLNIISANPNSQGQNSNHHMSSQMKGDVQRESKMIFYREVQPVTATSNNNLSLRQADNDEHTFTSTTSGTHFGEAPARDEQNSSQEGEHIGDTSVSNDLSVSEISDHAGSQPAQALGSNCTNHEALNFEPAEQMVPFPSPISPPTCNLIDVASVRVENEPSLDSAENEPSRDNNPSKQVSQVEALLAENILESLNQDVLPGIPCVYSIEDEPRREDNASNQVSQVPIPVEDSFEVLNQVVLPDIPLVDSIENEPSRHVSAQVSHAPIPFVANSLEHSNQTVSHPVNSLSLHPYIDVPIGGPEAHIAETRTTLTTGIRNHPTETASAAVSCVPLPVFVDPLQNQLERLRKEAEQLHKFHVDKRLQLESDYEKEKAELDRKYELKFQEENSRYLAIKKENDMNQNIVLMNQILAEAFRSKCMDIKPSSNSVVQQDTNPSFMQQLAQVQQNAQRSSLMAPSIALHNSAPVPNQQTTSHAPLYTVAPLSTTVSGSSSLFADISTRPRAPPPHIGSLSTSSTNVRVNSDLRAPAPHLQFNRPSAHSTVNIHQTHPRGISIPHVNINLPLTSDSLPLPNQLPSLTHLTGSHSRSHIPEHGLRILPNSSLSAVELHQDSISFPPIPNVAPNVCWQNFSEPSTGMHTDPVQRDGCNDVVCLSDDE